MNEQDLKDLVLEKEIEVKRWQSSMKTIWIAMYGSGAPKSAEELVAHVTTTLKQYAKEIADLADENDRLRTQVNDLLQQQPPTGGTKKREKKSVTRTQGDKPA